jgi:hypothetical protein
VTRQTATHNAAASAAAIAIAAAATATIVDADKEASIVGREVHAGNVANQIQILQIITPRWKRSECETTRQTFVWGKCKGNGMHRT